ncbi:MAG: hypothetical protein J6Y94_05090 [Bacteriovoracaceae bacterium]|nr:hypothetical protein [Bacteriovoracaceae bacterium]
METKIYRDFHEFKALNRDLLKLLAISDEHAQGIWDARQGEIIELKAQIQSLQTQMKALEQSLATQALAHADEVKQIQEKNKVLKQEKSQTVAALKACEAELARVQGFQAEQDALVHAASGQIDQVLAENQQLKANLDLMQDQKRHLEFSLQPLELYGEKMNRDLGEYAAQVEALEAALNREKKYSADLKTYVENFKDNAQALKKVAIQAQQERDQILHAKQQDEAKLQHLRRQLGEQQEQVDKVLRQKEEYVLAFREEKRKLAAQERIMAHERQQKAALAAELQQVRQTNGQLAQREKQWHLERDGLSALIARLEADKNRLSEERQIVESNLAKVKNSLRVISEA